MAEAEGVIGGAASGAATGAAAGPWGAVAGAVIGAGAALFGGSQQRKANEKAQERERKAAEEARAEQRRRFEEGRAALQPYAQQEQAASLQMMAQMGLTPPPGTRAGGGAFGFGAPPVGQAPGEIAAQQMMEDLITQQMTINHRNGMDLDSRNIAESSRQAIKQIRDMKAAGQLPDDFPELSQSEWQNLGYDQRSAHGGMKSMRRSMEIARDPQGGLLSQPDVAGLTERYTATAAGGGDFQTQQMGAGQMLDPITGEPVDRMGGGDVAGMPAPKTAQDIMRMAGIEGLPPEIQQQYLRELAEDPRTDPGLAAYLGLTEESLQVGAGYQDTPAYAAAREAGVEAVEAGAAGGGTLYSGSRGKALRDVGQGVEQAYYQDAMNRRANMMGARRGQRREDIGRRGREYGAERSREQSYYNNYMNLLNQLAAPTTTTNIAAMGTSIGKAEAANLLGTARNVGDLQMGQAANDAAMWGDIATGAGQVAEAWINRDREEATQGPVMQQNDPPGLAALTPAVGDSFT